MKRGSRLALCLALLWAQSAAAHHSFDAEFDRNKPVTFTATVTRAPIVSTPLVHDGLLYLVANGGILTVVEPNTGALVKQSRLEGAIDAYYSSPVSADDKIVRSFLGPAKLHQRRDCLPDRCLFRRAPTSSCVNVWPGTIWARPFSASRANQPRASPLISRLHPWLVASISCRVPRG